MGAGKIVILDYGAGNLTSVRLAFGRLGAPAEVSGDPAVAAKADSLVFPGVGSAASGMEGLHRCGLDKVLLEAARSGKPVLAICLGMQMLLSFSEEDGGVTGLGLIEGSVRKFVFPPNAHVKVPHMGWNTVEHEGKHPLFAGIPSGEAFYFVHSYHASEVGKDDIPGTSEYAGKRFACAVGRSNVIGVQFHPERSGEAGLQMLENFTKWDGRYATETSDRLS